MFKICYGSPLESHLIIAEETDACICQ